MTRLFLATALAVGASAGPLRPPGPAAAQPAAPPAPAAQAGRPALGVFPPNATRVTATVVRQGTTVAEYLPAQPDVPAGTTLPSLTIEIQTASQARVDLPVGPAVGVIDVVSREPLPPALIGRRIDAEITLVGTTRASRWVISHIRALPD